MVDAVKAVEKTVEIVVEIDLGGWSLKVSIKWILN